MFCPHSELGEKLCLRPRMRSKMDLGGDRKVSVHNRKETVCRPKTALPHRASTKQVHAWGPNIFGCHSELPEKLRFCPRMRSKMDHDADRNVSVRNRRETGFWPQSANPSRASSHRHFAGRPHAIGARSCDCTKRADSADGRARARVMDRGRGTGTGPVVCNAVALVAGPKS